MPELASNLAEIKFVLHSNRVKNLLPKFIQISVKIGQILFSELLSELVLKLKKNVLICRQNASMQVFLNVAIRLLANS